MRAVFEALIDRAWAEEAAFNSFLGTDDTGPERNGGDAGRSLGGVSVPERGSGRAEPDDKASSAVPAALASMVCVGRALSLSGHVLAMAVSMAGALVESSGRYARENWRIITRAQPEPSRSIPGHFGSTT